MGSQSSSCIARKLEGRSWWLDRAEVREPRLDPCKAPSRLGGERVCEVSSSIGDGGGVTARAPPQSHELIFRFGDDARDPVSPSTGFDPTTEIFSAASKLTLVLGACVSLLDSSTPSSPTELLSAAAARAAAALSRSWSSSSFNLSFSLRNSSASADLASKAAALAASAA